MHGKTQYLSNIIKEWKETNFLVHIQSQCDFKITLSFLKHATSQNEQWPLKASFRGHYPFKGRLSLYGPS
jgi:hypothetical protein